MPASDSTATRSQPVVNDKKQESWVKRTRLRDTAVSLAIFAALLWLMSQTAFA